MGDVYPVKKVDYGSVKVGQWVAGQLVAVREYRVEMRISVQHHIEPPVSVLVAS